MISACNLTIDEEISTPLIVEIPSPVPSASAVSTWADAADVMHGICFESAYDAAGRLFVIRSAEEHILFYDQADNSRLCRRAVRRYPFDFTGGDVLAGLWSMGRGCKANHEVISFERDDVAKTITMHLRLVIEGDCPYELVRPFWVRLPRASDYAVEIAVVETVTTTNR